MYTFGPIAAAIGVAHTVVLFLTGALTPMFGTTAAAVAIIGLTVLIRLLLLPLSYFQVRAEKTRARLAPALTALRERYARTPERLLEETQKLYAKEGASPLAGCLPGLAQLPVFVAVYGLFVTARIDGTANQLLAHDLAGVSLGSTFGQALAGGQGLSVVVFLGLFALLGMVAWATRRWLTLPALAQAQANGQPPLPGMGLVAYLPYAMLLAAAFVPLAAGVYLVASGVWTVGERVVLRRVVPAG